MLELCANEITDLTELCWDPPPLVHLGLGFNQITDTYDYLTTQYWSVYLSISLPVYCLTMTMIRR